MLPEIVARSLPEANQDIVTLGPRAAVVSIGTPGTDPPYGFKPFNPLHLRLEFHDVVATDDLEEGILPPDRQIVVRLLDAAKVLRVADRVYVHCHAGISRSTAIAYLLWCAWLGPGNEPEALRRVFADRPQAVPNPLIVQHGDELLGREGAMIAALEEHTTVAAARRREALTQFAPDQPPRE